jgi:predicted ATPase
MEPYLPTTKYVITGGPGSGKSSVLEALRSRGYTTIDEAARPIKEEQRLRKEQGQSYILPENDNYGFQRMIYTKQVELERGCYGPSFIDRGVVDNIAYCRRFSTPVCGELDGLCRSSDYSKVFILDPLPQRFYEQDAARDEDYAESVLLGNLLAEAYHDYGHEVVRVPYFEGGSKKESIDARVQHILDSLR